MNKRLILASTSPRRQELLKLLNISFDIEASKFEETIVQNVSPEKLVQDLAYGKASEVANRVENAVVIGGDTVVTLEETTLGKPTSKEDAHNMLWRSRGKTQIIYTGTSIFDSNSKNHEEFTVSLKVQFRLFTKGELEWYLSTDEPYDKAGAYAVQGAGSILIEKINGDLLGGIGIPVKELFLRLPNFGINL